MTSHHDDGRGGSRRTILEAMDLGGNRRSVDIARSTPRSMGIIG
jgi:hypothetical protein